MVNVPSKGDGDKGDGDLGERGNGLRERELSRSGRAPSVGMDSASFKERALSDAVSSLSSAEVYCVTVGRTKVNSISSTSIVSSLTSVVWIESCLRRALLRKAGKEILERKD